MGLGLLFKALQVCDDLLKARYCFSIDAFVASVDGSPAGMRLEHTAVLLVDFTQEHTGEQCGFGVGAAHHLDGEIIDNLHEIYYDLLELFLMGTAYHTHL